MIPEDSQVILTDDDFESIMNALRDANEQHSELRSVHQFVYFLHLYYVLLSNNLLMYPNSWRIGDTCILYSLDEIIQSFSIFYSRLSNRVE